MTILYSIRDFEALKARLDQTYQHRHTGGEPARYPCVVQSEWWDDPNGPYTYSHAFAYFNQAIPEGLELINE